MEAVERLNHDAGKPTLDRSGDSAQAEDLNSLDLISAAALLALHRSTSDRAPTTPCFALTQALAGDLSQHRIIEVCGDGDLVRAEPAHRSIYDPFEWRYRWSSATDPGFGEALRARIREIASDVASTQAKHVLWQILANAEVEGYLGYLLRRHGFDSRWAVDARDQGQRWGRGLSLAQMRYVVWASVREGAAAFLRSGGDVDEARDSIALEIRRRSKWVEARPDLGQSFLPAQSTRQSILLTVFLEDIAPIGQQYWLSSPSEAVLRDADSTPPASRPRVGGDF